ncbi:MAG: pyrroline-5-carboxylate reductase [Bacteroidota bacterium]|nr:pyrroline-5-carboxylate reductase [Bacteroidota bacterium]
MNNLKFSIIGAGNMGSAIAEGFLKTGAIKPANIWITDLRVEALDHFKAKGVNTGSNNKEAVAFADVLIIAVKPYLVKTILDEIKPQIAHSRQILISIAAGISISDIEATTGKLPIFRAIPNTAIAIQESMTCIADANANQEQKDLVMSVFNLLGKAALIPEDMMNAATVIGSCETAYILRFIRATVEGGVEIGFKPDLAQLIVSQTVLGAAKLLLTTNSHPEVEIDKVCTPKGITIVGLNEMEHAGFSSSVMKGIEAAYSVFKK